MDCPRPYLGDDGVLDVKLRGQKWQLVTQFDSVKRLKKYKAIAGPSFKKFKDPGICFPEAVKSTCLKGGPRSEHTSR